MFGFSFNKVQNVEQSHREWANVIKVFISSIGFETKYMLNDRLKTKMTSWIDNLILKYVL